jgi:hypothetical protein
MTGQAMRPQEHGNVTATERDEIIGSQRLSEGHGSV